jgi:hypothetical protein
MIIMTIKNIINKRSRKKRVKKIIEVLIALFFCASVSGCNPPIILITRAGPFHLPQVRTMVFLPFHGNVTECATEAHYAMETTLSTYFSRRGIQMIPTPPKLSKIIGVSGVLNKEKVQQIGKDSQADALISGSISQCHYFNSDVGEGSVFLTVKIYDGKTGYLLLVVNGKKITETGSESINQMTIEIVNTMFEMLGWETY